MLIVGLSMLIVGLLMLVVGSVNVSCWDCQC